MACDPAYTRFLRKLYFLETVGEEFYRVLARKAPTPERHSAYLGLAEGERHTGDLIRKEILSLGCAGGVRCPAIAVGFVRVFSRVFSERQLLRFLRRVLDRRLYQRSFGKYRECNEAFWQELLGHEERQRVFFEGTGQAA